MPAKHKPTHWTIMHFVRRPQRPITVLQLLNTLAAQARDDYALPGHHTNDTTRSITAVTEAWPGDTITIKILSY